MPRLLSPPALPDGRLVQRRGLGHAKKLTPAVIAATLTEFLTAGNHAPGPSVAMTVRRDEPR